MQPLRCHTPPAPAPPRFLPAQTLHTLVGQGHLAPLPMAAQPVYWEHDHSLRLLPLPDVLVLAENREPADLESSGMRMLCPGSFARATEHCHHFLR